MIRIIILIITIIIIIFIKKVDFRRLITLAFAVKVKFVFKTEKRMSKITLVIVIKVSTSSVGSLVRNVHDSSFVSKEKDR